MHKLIILASAAALAPAAIAQDAPVAPAVAPAPAPNMAPQLQILQPKGEMVLRAGTPVAVRTLVDLTTKGKKLRVGDRINIEVAETVTLAGHPVIPAGTPGMAELTRVRNKGMWGKSGAIEGRLLYIRVGDRQIRMSGAFNDKGVTGTAGVVGAVLLLPVAGFLTTGTSAKIPLGSVINGFLDEDIAVAAPAPVAAPTPVAIQPAVVQPVAAQPAAAVQPVAAAEPTP